jgi:hypothetical protein
MATGEAGESGTSSGITRLSVGGSLNHGVDGARRRQEKFNRDPRDFSLLFSKNSNPSSTHSMRPPVS